MKNVLIGCISAAIFMACENKSHEKKTSVNELESYVDSIEKLDEATVSSHWIAIENGYRAKVLKADASEKNEEEKRELSETKADYQEFRAKYTSEPLVKEGENESQTDVVKPENRRSLRNVLFGEGKIGADMDFKWVTASNIRQVYEHFVSSVKANKDNFSREDWDEIKVLYEALDTRKNEVEKDLSSKDNIAIAKRKVEFASYKIIDRPAAKIEENMEAKENGNK